MANFKLSAFADEYSGNFDAQIEGLQINKIEYMEIRGVNGKNISTLTKDEVIEVKKKLDGGGIKISSIGSPIGKINVKDDFAKHLDLLKNVCETALILNTDKIRMFSFYLPDANIETYKNEVIEKMGQMLDVADTYSVNLCHENEKGIYGENAVRCLELLKAYDGRLKCIFDHANFIQSGVKPYPDAFELLKNYICYLHIKDADENGRIVVAGKGTGCIPETLKAIDALYSGDMILSVEPHLRIFRGFASLENAERTKMGNAYATSEEAFGAAVEGIRNCLDLISQ